MSNEPSGDMDPEQAARVAVDGPEAASAVSDAGHMAAEGMDPSAGRPWYLEAARNTSPNPPIQQVGSFRDLRDNWERFGVRGLQKLGGVDDAEAWVDLTKFVVGFALETFGSADAQEAADDEMELAAGEAEFDPSQIDERYRDESQ